VRRLRRIRGIASVRSGSAALLLICLSACNGQRPQAPSSASVGELRITGNERLRWTQAASDFRDLTACSYWVYVDDVRLPLEAQCSYQPSQSSHTCTAPLPRMAPGRHILELTTSASQAPEAPESPRSERLVVFMTGDVSAARDERANAAAALPKPGAVTGVPLAPATDTLSADSFTTTYLASGLNAPAAIAPLPDGSILVGERAGTIKIVRPYEGGVDVSLEPGELGDVDNSEIVLHGMALHPAFARKAFLYVMYTEVNQESEPITRVARFRFVAGLLGERAILLDDLPARRVSPGGALAFGRDGALYVATDDGDRPAGSSDAGALGGTLRRLTDDGRTKSNLAGGPDLLSGLHRPSALGWDDARARAWVIDDALPTMDGRSPQQSISVQTISDVSSACVYSSRAMPTLVGRLVIARGDALAYTDLRPGAGGMPRSLWEPGLGRIQVVQTDSDGVLYVATGNTDRHAARGRDLLIRLIPRLRARSASDP